MSAHRNAWLIWGIIASMMDIEVHGFVVDTRNMVWNENPPSLSGPVGLTLNGKYGEICDDAHFEQTAANVLCLSLGYNQASKNIAKRASTKVWLASVDCSGSETNILDCNHIVSSSTPCYSVVSLTCTMHEGESEQIWWKIMLGVIGALCLLAFIGHNCRKSLQWKQTAQSQSQTANAMIVKESGRTIQVQAPARLSSIPLLPPVAPPGPSATSLENLPPPPTYSDLYPEHSVQISTDYHPDDPFGPDSHNVTFKSTVRHLMEKGPELTFGEPQVIGGATFIAAAVRVTSNTEVRKAFRRFMMGPGRMTARYNIAYFRLYNEVTAKISEGCKNDGDLAVGKMIRSKLHARELYNIAVFLSESSDGSDVCSDTLRAMEDSVNSALNKMAL